MDANREVFSGVAELYDTYRPSPPDVLPDLLTQLAQVAFPSLVVDIGSGTGLSTIVWQQRAKAIIGIEPNADMLQVARSRIASLPSPHSISLQQGVASHIELPDVCADIVTCAQSFHWMEPKSSLAEVARILRPGGVFAAYDYLWPPTINWQAEQAYETFIDRAWTLKEQRGLEQDLQLWPQNRQLSSLQEGGHFRYVKQLWLHRQETGNAERFVGLALTNGVIQYLHKGLLREDDIGLASFQQAAQETIGSQPIPWYFSYHLRIAIK